VRPPIAWTLLLAIASLRVAFHLFAAACLAWGYTSDELYFLDSADRLAWGYVDHPPLTVVVLAGWTGLFGDSLVAVRTLSSLLAGLHVALTGLLARELGGGCTAQALAALAVFFFPLSTALTGSYQINSFDLVFWAVAFLLVLRIGNGAGPRTWLALGFTLGLGLLNKYTLLWFGAGLGLGLVGTPERRWLATPWPWLAAALALALFSPHVVWQVQHDWPTVEFLRNKASDQIPHIPPLLFVVDQLKTTGTLLPVVAAGLVWLLAAREARPHRIVAVVWLGVVGLLMFSGSGRSYYTAGAYPVLLAAGGVALERLTQTRGWRWLPAVATAWFVVLGLYMTPFTVPVLSPEHFIAFRRSYPFSMPQQRVDDVAPLPIHFADRLHGPVVMEAISRAFATLEPHERERVAIFTTGIDTAGAVSHWGPAAGMPRAIGSHNSYWLWGPGDASGEVMILAWPRDRDLSWWFADVERVAEFDCRYCQIQLERQSVFVGRRPRLPLAEAWPRLKDYH
jgi:hypothetical protein